MTVTLPDRETDRAAAGTLPSVMRWTGARPTLAVVALALVGGGVAASSPSVILLGLVATGSALANERLPLDVAIPSAAIALLLVAVAAGLAADAVGVDLLSHPGGLATAYVLVSLAVVIRSLTSLPRVVTREGAPRWSAIAKASVPYVPALVALGTGVAQAAVPGLAKSWALWATDVPRHMTTIELLQRDGRLDYSTSGYPRGLHMLAALASVPTIPRSGSVQLLDYDLRLASALTWFALALMLLVGAALAVRVARALGLAPTVGAGAALLVGAGAMLTNTFLLSFVYMGAAPSLFAVAVLQWIPLTLLVSERNDRRLAVVTVACAVAAAALAHLWQALVTAPVAAWVLVVGVGLLRRRARGWSRTEVDALRVAVPVAVLLAAVSVPPVFGVQREAGLGYAAVPGHLSGVPWHLLLPCLVSLLVVIYLGRRSVGVLCCLGVAAGLVVTVVVILRATGRPTDLDQYYPQKAAWFLALFLAPLLSVVFVGAMRAALRGVWRLSRLAGSHAFVVRTVVIGLLIGPVAAAWLGYLIGVQSVALTTWTPARHSTPGSTTPTDELSAVRYDIAARFGTMKGSRVVVPWVIGEAPYDSYGTLTVSLLLNFLTGQPQVQGGHTACDFVRAVAGDRPALIISQLPRKAVRDSMAKGGCQGEAAVLHVPNVGYRN
jgi:hypothetical protein